MAQVFVTFSSILTRGLWPLIKLVITCWLISASSCKIFQRKLKRKLLVKLLCWPIKRCFACQLIHLTKQKKSVKNTSAQAYMFIKQNFAQILGYVLIFLLSINMGTTAQVKLWYSEENEHCWWYLHQIAVSSVYHLRHERLSSLWQGLTPNSAHA